MASLFLFVFFRKADDMFGHLDVWANVPDRDRRDLFDDVIHMLAKREKVTKSGRYIISLKSHTYNISLHLLIYTAT